MLFRSCVVYGKGAANLIGLAKAVEEIYFFP